MRSILAPAAALLLLSGCVIHADSKEPAPVPAVGGDITFLWSFAGKTCAQAPEVNWVRVVLEGGAGVEALPNDGYYRCNWDGWDGVKLTDFRAGTYNYTVDAVDSGDLVVYTATGTLSVNGPVQVPVNLNPTMIRGEMEVFWSFGREAKGCAQAGITTTDPVSTVKVSVNNEPPYEMPCTYGQQSAVYTDLAPGTYSVKIEGYIGDRLWYRGLRSVTVSGQGGSYQLPVQLDAVAAGATFAPVMGDGVTAFDCASTGTTALQIQLWDSKDQCFPADPLAPGGCGFNGSCAAFATNGFYFDYMPADDRWDAAAKAWTANWTAQITGWGVDANDVTYVGSLDTLIYAGEPDQRVPVRMQIH